MKAIAAASFTPGAPGGDCIFYFSISSSVLSDPNDHNCCTGVQSVSSMRFEFFTDGFETGDTSAWGSGSGSYDASGAVFGLGRLQQGTITFTSGGVGTVAGFTNVDHTFDGSFETDEMGLPTSFTAVLTLDADNDQLPDSGSGRNPVRYTVTGTLSSGPGG